MIKLNKLSIQGFRSFSEQEVFDLSKFPVGFYLLVGENQVEKDLGSNGSGKTSLFEALCWVLYGKISTNLKAGSIKNWDSSVKCKVEVQFDRNGQSIHIIRQWNPNSLLVSIGSNLPKTMSQEEVVGLIGMDFRSFLHSVFISQFSSKFFDLTPSDRLLVLSDILNLDQWLTYSSKSKVLEKDCDSKLRILEQDDSRKEGEIDSLLRQDYDNLIKQWSSTKEQSEKLFSKDLKLISKDLEGIKEDKKDLQEEDLPLSPQMEEFRLSIIEITEEISNLKIKLSEHKGDLKAAETTLYSNSDELTKFQEVKESCPYCYQSVTNEYLKGKISEINSDLDISAAKCDEIDYEIKEIEAIVLKKQTENSGIKEKLLSLEELHFSLEADIRELDSKEEKLSWEISSKTAEYKKLKSERNPYLELKEENEIKIKALEEDKEKLSKEIEEKRGLEERYKYWVKGFKEIRLLVVSEIMKEFEVYVNNQLLALGMSDWKVEFSVDIETKSGTISRGFFVNVYSPLNDEMKPFECWSGGEGQRLRLAGTLGLMSLVSSRSEMGWDVEVFDEPTQFLSEEGIDNLLELLKRRSSESGKKIFVIDHRDFDSAGLFDSIITVRKSVEGSKIIF